MGNYQERALESCQILLENIERHQIQIIGRLIKYQKVGTSHQHGQQIQPAPLASAQTSHPVAVHRRRKHKIIQEGHRRYGLPFTDRHHIRYLGDSVDHCLLTVELDSFLPVISDAQGLSSVNGPGRRLYPTGQQIKEGALAHPVRTDDSYFLPGGEIICKIIYYRQVRPRIAQVRAVDGLTAEPGHPGLNLYLTVLPSLTGPVLEIIKCINTVFGLCSACAGHPSHPVKLGT